jgi:hypothetical protein
VTLVLYGALAGVISSQTLSVDKVFKGYALSQLRGCAPFCEVSFLAHGQSQSNNPCSRLLLSGGPVWAPETCKGYEEQQADFC